jgi:hypothetical protein
VALDLLPGEPREVQLRVDRQDVALVQQVVPRDRGVGRRSQIGQLPGFLA